jgi:uncharacterized protein GlcG (DUF336 family)
MRTVVFAAFLALALSAIGTRPSLAGDYYDNPQGGRCSIPIGTVAMIQSQLATVVKSGNGGYFTPNRMWSAIVDRQGVLCSVIEIGDAWPGSRDIAIAKASTANGFSNGGSGGIALSTANLYSATQPGGSLYGLNNSNPFNPMFNPQGTGIGFVPGGVITFGGGVALYANGAVIGGLGVSGDTSCADHAIAYQMRAKAGYGNTPTNDNIQYLSAGEPPNGFKQPHCLSTDVTP